MPNPGLGVDLRLHPSYPAAAGAFAVMAEDTQPTRGEVMANMAHYYMYIDLGYYTGSPVSCISIQHPAALAMYVTERDTIDIPGSVHFYSMVMPSDFRGISVLDVDGDIFCGNCLDVGPRTDIICRGNIYMSPNLLRCRNLTANHVYSPDIVHVSGEIDVQTLGARLIYRAGEVLDDARIKASV
jgi:hypothetical protein